MELTEDKVKSRELIKLLTEKFDKLQFKYEVSDYYTLEINSCKIRIGKVELFIYNSDGFLILSNIPTAEQRDAYNHVVLWGKIVKKYQQSTDVALNTLLEELNKLG